MSRLKLDIKTKRLHRLLGTAEPSSFCVMLWCADALRTGRSDNARRFIKNIPAKALEKGYGPFSIHPWELDSVFTEYISTDVSYQRRGGGVRTLNCSSFSALIAVINALRAVEDAQSGAYLGQVNIFSELGRISQRQFHWQRGYLNRSHLYKAAAIYGGKLSNAYLENSLGLDFNEISLAAFVAYGSTRTHPGCPLPLDLTEFGMSKSKAENAVRLLSATIDEFRHEAQRDSKPGIPIAYKRSLLRKKPLVRNDDGLLAPIGDLILLRSTMGVYYDLVTGGGAVTNEVGRSFETYCRHFLERTLEHINTRAENRYGSSGRGFDSPDIFLSDRLGDVVLIECKSTKMTIAAQYSFDPVNEAQRAFEDLAKGVFQIWRYCSHVRLGIATGHPLAPNPVGLLLTLDYWAMMSSEQYHAIIKLARKRADRDINIIEADRIAIAICQIDDLENGVKVVDDFGLITAIRAMASDEYAGWLLPAIIEKLELGSTTERDHPFADHLSDVLPWWAQLS